MPFLSVPVRFLKKLLIVTIALAAILLYPVTEWMTARQQDALMAAAITALSNLLLGYLTLAYAIDKSNSTFMIGVFGGMGVRMALVLGTLAILLVNRYDALTLSLSFMGFYAISMILEIQLVLSEMGIRKRDSGAGRPASRKSVTRSHSFFFELERN